MSPSMAQTCLKVLICVCCVTMAFSKEGDEGELCKYESKNGDHVGTCSEGLVCDASFMCEREMGLPPAGEVCKAEQTSDGTFIGKCAYGLVCDESFMCERETRLPPEGEICKAHEKADGSYIGKCAHGLVCDTSFMCEKEMGLPPKGKACKKGERVNGEPHGKCAYGLVCDKKFVCEKPDPATSGLPISAEFSTSAIFDRSRLPLASSAGVIAALMAGAFALTVAAFVVVRRRSHRWDIGSSSGVELIEDAEIGTD